MSLGSHIQFFCFVLVLAFTLLLSVQSEVSEVLAVEACGLFASNNSMDFNMVLLTNFWQRRTHSSSVTSQIAHLRWATSGPPMPGHSWLWWVGHWWPIHATSGPPTAANCDLATHIHRWPTGGMLSGIIPYY